MYLFYDVNLTILPLDRPITAEFINNSFVSTNDQLNSQLNHLLIKDGNLANRDCAFNQIYDLLKFLRRLNRGSFYLSATVLKFRDI